MIENFISAIFGTLGAVIFCAVNMDVTINQDQIVAANIVCEPNGGLVSLSSDNFGKSSFLATCANGVQIWSYVKSVEVKK